MISILHDSDFMDRCEIVLALSPTNSDSSLSYSSDDCDAFDILNPVISLPKDSNNSHKKISNSNIMYDITKVNEFVFFSIFLFR